ncbi:class I adenylate-forming enzyme family protein [Phytohabitans suffuscus]|uniref:O-succinylbenzoate--CoA ligase n=1 Tax=Phytohabitans suffuscus TaxID=624315 RepID=A0A6F8YCP0_9ACTN|nr:fatty acid--CoA ligase family protein [Phytohabitans suffuscus]BCB83789.1 o-succinylbenzoate--CoA ligase [Phytohabitans suffuscus]
MIAETGHSVSQRLADVMRIDPDADALQFHGRWTSWGRLRELGDAVQAVLAEQGVSPRAPVAMVMRNRPATVAVVLSLLTQGQTLVTVSGMQPDARLAAELPSLPAAVLLADPQDWARPGVREAAQAAGALAIAVDESGARVLEPLRHGDAEEFAVPGTAILMLTSGTTGPPKRIPLTYGGFDAGYAAAAHYERGAGGVRLRASVAIVMAPLLHVSGIFTLLLNVQAGRKIALLERFTVDDWLELVSEHRPKAITLPPAALRMVMAAEVPPERLSFARSVLVGTAPISVEDQLAWERRYGIPVLVVYGATEFAGGIAGWTLREHHRYADSKRGSVGRAHPGVRLRVTDEASGEPLGVDEVGLLEVKAAQLGERGARWVRTTDRARLDADGFLWIVGRADDVIIRGGFKVSTGTVAEALKQHPAVQDAGVVGLDDARLGQVPVAAVEIDPAQPVDEEELVRFARERLTPYQVPARIHIVEALPRTPALKVNGPALRELLRGRAGEG